MSSVYIETSIIGYLAMRMSKEIVTAGNQQLTLDWWENRRGKFRGLSANLEL